MKWAALAKWSQLFEDSHEFNGLSSGEYQF